MVDQIDIEKLMTQEEKAEGTGTSALPGLVRELIRTPGFKELLFIHLRDINPENAKQLIRNVIWEDVVFSMSIIGATPGLINWLAEALVELGVQLNNFTLEMLRDFLVKMGSDLDIEKLKSIPAAYAPLANELLLDDREALDGLIAGLGSIAEELAQATERTWRKIWNTADFGKIRVGLTEHLEGRMAELESEPGIFNPVSISNLLGVVPPLANYMMRVLTRTLQALNLPAEILANAVFQILEDIDMAEVGGLVNALAGVTTALHRGNLLLGRDEPRLKDVLGRVSRDLVDNVDGEQLKQMLVSLKEDGAVIGGVISDYVFATPDSTVQVVRALYLAVDAALRTVSETYRKISELPPQALGDIMDAYDEALDVREISKIANYHAVLFNKVCEERPDWVSDTLAKILAGLDNEELARTSKTVALQVKDAVLADPAISAALEPEAIGERINAGLAVFNRFCWENPHLMAEKAARTLAVLDMDEVVLAVNELVVTTVRALLKNPDVIKKAMKPFAKPAAIMAAAGAVVMGGLVGGVLILRRRRK